MWLPVDIWNIILSFIDIDKDEWYNLSLVSCNVHDALDMQRVSYKLTDIWDTKYKTRHEYIIIKDIHDKSDLYRAFEILNNNYYMEPSLVIFENISCKLMIDHLPYEVRKLFINHCKYVHLDPVRLSYIECNHVESLKIERPEKQPTIMKLTNVESVEIREFD